MKLRALVSTIGSSGMARRGGLGLAIKVLGVGLSFLVTVVLVRVIGAEAFGAYAFAFAIVSLLAIPVQAGLPPLVVRETARAHAAQDWDRMKGLWSWAGRVVLVMSVPITAVTALVLLAGPADLLSEARRAAILAGLVLIPVVAANQVRGAALRGLKMTVLGQAPDQVVRPALIILLALAVPVTLSAAGAILVHAAAAGIAFAAGMLALFLRQPAEVRAARPDRNQGGAWLRALLPFSLIAGIQLLLQNMDVVLLGIFHTDEAVAVYRVAFTVANLVAIGLTALVLVLQPFIAEAAGRQDWKRIELLASGSAVAISAVTLPAALFLLVFGRPLLEGVMGPEFVRSYLPMMILVAGHVSNAVFGAVIMVLNMSGHERRTVWGLGATVLVHLGLSLLLIPAHGAVGAAIATAISLTLRNLLIWYLVRRTLGIDCLPFSFPRHLRARSARAPEDPDPG